MFQPLGSSLELGWREAVWSVYAQTALAVSLPSQAVDIELANKYLLCM